MGKRIVSPIYKKCNKNIIIMKKINAEKMLEDLIRKAFDEEDDNIFSERPRQLIELARAYGLNDLANQMEIDLE